MYEGGMARTWTINTAGTAIVSNALSVTVNGASIGGWTSAPDQQVAFDVASTGATARIKIAEAVWLQIAANGEASIWNMYQNTNAYPLLSRSPAAVIGGTGSTGRWVVTAVGRVVTVYRPSGTGDSVRVILPYARMNASNVDFAANTYNASWGIVAEVGDLLIDNVVIGVPA